MPTQKQPFGQRASKLREAAEALRVHANAVRDDASMFAGIAETVMSEVLLMEASAKRFAEKRSTTKARR
jgi:hypothetical protein